MSEKLRTILWGLIGIAMLVFIFGPVLGLRETGTQARSRRIQEDFDRRQREAFEANKRDATRNDAMIERAKKEIFGDR